MKPELIPLKDSASAWEQAYIEEYNNYLKSIPDFYTNLGWYRMNVDLLQFTSLLPKYSFIWRDLKFRRENDELNQSGGFSYSSQSMTHVIYLDYSLDEDLKLKGYLSMESVQREYESESDEGSHSKNYPKAGLSAAFLSNKTPFAIRFRESCQPGFWFPTPILKLCKPSLNTFLLFIELD